jgi:hypothetical protein
LEELKFDCGGKMILTENAALDNLTNQDYWDMCDELRISLDETGKTCNLSWDKFILKVGSFKYKAQWAKWRNGEGNLQWDMKNDLRRAVGLPELPKPVQQVLEEHVHENAKIYASELKTGQWARYVQLSETEPTTGLDLASGESEHVAVTFKPKRAKRIGVMRPSVSTKYDSWRKKLGKSWEDVVQAGLISIERGDIDGKKGKGGRLNGH